MRNRQALLILLAAAAVAAVLRVGWTPSPPPSQNPGFVPQNQGSESAPVPDAVAAPGAARHFGYTPNPDATRQFLRTLSKPELQQAGPGLQIRAGEPVLLYRALFKAYDSYRPGQRWIVGRQGIGDCVSWGWAHCCDIHLAVMFCLGDTSEWRPAATEAIYGGSRVEARGKTEGTGGYSDGSYGGAAAKWVSQWGVLFREVYATQHGDVDLRAYSADRAKDWGNAGCGGKGDKGELDEVAKKHPVRNVALVKSFEAAAQAIQSGYPVAVCSSQGFSSHRIEQGFAQASGTWYHCMAFIGVRFDPDGLLCLNSWGPSWIDGPKWPDDMPEGSFWVARSTVDRMLSGGDSFAVSGYEGFPYRQLKHDAWVFSPRSPEEVAYVSLAP